jgi:hypothetical protein
MVEPKRLPVPYANVAGSTSQSIKPTLHHDFPELSVLIDAPLPLDLGTNPAGTIATMASATAAPLGSIMTASPINRMFVSFDELYGAVGLESCSIPALHVIGR